MKLEQGVKKRKTSRGKNYRRFFTSRDMAIVKHDASVTQARRNRGEIEHTAVECIYPCSCGREGCFIHSGYNPNPYYV